MARKPVQKDPMGLFVRVYVEVLDSPAWAALSWSAQGLYMGLRRKLNASAANNGNIEAVLTTLKQSGFTSSSSLAKGLRELQAVGLIAKTRGSVGVENGSNVCCLYRFTDLSCYAFPKLGLDTMAASYDWRKFKSVDQALVAIQSADEEAQRRHKDRRDREKTTPQKTNRLNSKSESTHLSVESKFEQGGIPSTRNPNTRQHPANKCTTRMDKGFEPKTEPDTEFALTTSKFEHLLTVAIHQGESCMETTHV